MIWMPLLMAAYAYATPIPPTPIPASPASFNHIHHLVPALPPGATARISAQGNNIPCWDSPASLTAFTQAYQSGNQGAYAMQVANDSFFLEEGMRVASVQTQGLLGQIIKLKILDGDRAGTECYVQAVLKLYKDIKPAKRSKRP